MQVCLVNSATGAEFSDPTEFGIVPLREEVSEPQLGILSLAAVLEANGMQPRIVDLNQIFFALADSDAPGKIDEFATIAARQLANLGMDVYGFGTICSAYPVTIRIAKELKRLNPTCTIIFGGPQASVVSRETLEAFPWIDFILGGEAEQTLPAFLGELAGAKRFERVLGMTYRTPFGVQKTPDAPVIQNLDDLPFPAYHLTGELRGKDRASIEAGRGCPFACTFCSTNNYFRRKFRLRSPERMISHMRAIEAEYGIRSFTLTHDMFTVDRKRVRAFCHAMIDSGTGYSWSCSARTDSVDTELLELMAASGCTAIFFGVETGSQRMQKIIDKHLDVNWAHQVIDIAEHAGIGSTISLITGFPQETIADLRDTVDMFMHSARTPRSNPQLNILSPLAHTPIHLQYKDQLVLEKLCSDTSHQGCRQHPEDFELIGRFPEIFPNFYLVSTPYLDRSFLLELREFSLTAETRFRWLFGAAAQASGDMLALFSSWMEHRAVQHPELSGQSVRTYYRSTQFSEEFLSFLRGLPSSSEPAMKSLMKFEESLASASSPFGVRPQSEELAPGAHVDPADVPCRRAASKVVELEFDLQQVIDAVREQRAPVLDGKHHFYVIEEKPDVANPIYEVSPRMARAALACDGLLTMRQAAEQISTSLPEIEEDKRRLYATGLIEKGWKEGILSMHRAASMTAPDRPPLTAVSP